MDYDQVPTFVAQYRQLQRLIPGVDGLYRVVQAVLDVSLKHDSRVLIVGAGGGREVELLGASPRRYRLTGVDPSEAMLAQARHYVDVLKLGERVDLVHGTVDGLAADEKFDAATSILVMHFLPDDGAKLNYLKQIRARLKSGAPLVLADVSFEDRRQFDLLAPVVACHAELAGLTREQAALPAPHIAEMPIVSAGRTCELLQQAGFSVVAPVFRGLWYGAWWATADHA